jgi:hypothetical protein
LPPLLLFCPPGDRELVHRLNDNPSPPPPPVALLLPSSLDTLAPLLLRESREELRKRLIAPPVRISPAGAMVDDPRRRKGLNRLLGFAAQLDRLFVGVGALETVVVVEEDPVGVI